MPTNPTAAAQEFLENLAEQLAISETRYVQAHNSYHSLGDWLGREGSTVRQYSPVVYVQGSFGLGTVIKPLTNDEEYDVDAVCVLRGFSKRTGSQADLKELVGDEIEAYRQAKGIKRRLREGRRCWTLNYADGAQFHMDLVPAIPNGESVRLLLEQRGLDATWALHAIAITDNEGQNYWDVTSHWPRSNPKGYIEWFKSRMVIQLERRRRQLAESIHASVEDIPDYRVRTPLQAAIMILKRHRDIMFAEDQTNCAPISIIITTLAAHAYQGEDQIADALLSILDRMEQFILRKGENFVIPNPTDPLENFADKWAEFPERKDAFFSWLEQAKYDFRNAAAKLYKQHIVESLGPHIGNELAHAAQVNSRVPLQPNKLLRPAITAVTSGLTTLPSFANEPRIPTKPQGFA